jgi:hypothetical protein
MHSLTKSITVFPTIVEEENEENEEKIYDGINNIPIMSLKLPSVLAYRQKHLIIFHNISQQFFYFKLENKKYTFHITNQKKCVDLIYFIIDILSGLNNNLIFDLILSSFNNNSKELKEFLNKPLNEIIFTCGEIII